jgi:hypothetical protein
VSATTNLVGSPILTKPEVAKNSDEFDRFKSLASVIVQVSKSDVDEQRKKT